MSATQWMIFEAEYAGGLSVLLTISMLLFLLQGGVIGALAWLINSALQNSDARVRYWLHVSALALMAACPPLTLYSLQSMSAPQTQQERRPQADGDFQSTLAAAAHGVGGERTPAANGERPMNVSRTNVASAPESGSRTPTSAPRQTSLASIAIIASQWIAAAYLLGAIFMLARLLRSLWQGQRLCRNLCRVEDGRLLNMMARQARRLGLRRTPRLAVCQQIAVPMVIGILRPLVILPSTLITTLQADQIEPLLAHELAHIRRLDVIVNLLQRFVESTLFFHPAIWFVSRQIDRERENACDDLVVSSGWRRIHYADALLRVAELYAAADGRAALVEPAAGVAASGLGPSDLKRRIMRVLELQQRPRLSVSRLGFAISLLAISILVAYPLAAYSAATANNNAAANNNTAANNGATNNNVADEKTVDPPAAAADVRTDKYGDPLPDGASARMGTIRLRQGDNVWAVAISPDGKLIASAGGDESICVWERSTGRRRLRLQLNSSRLRSIEFAPDGRTFAAADGQSLRVFDTSSGKLKSTFEVDGVSRLAFTDDGKQILAACGSYSTRGGVMSNSFGHVRLIDLSNGDTQLKIEKQGGFISSLSVAEAADVMVTASHDNSIRLWRLSDGKQLRSWPVQESFAGKWLDYQQQSRVALSRDGKLVAFSRPDGSLHIADAASGQFLRRLSGHGRIVTAIEFSPNGEQLASSGKDDVVRLWNVADGRQLKRFRHMNWVECLAFSPSGDFLVSGSQDGTVGVWPTAASVKRPSFEAHGNTIFCTALSPDGKQLATAGIDGLFMWDAKTGRLLFRQKTPTWVRSISFSLDGKLLALAGGEDQVRIINGASGELIRELAGHGKGATLIEFLHTTPPGLLSVGRDNALRVWIPSHGKLISRLAPKPGNAAVLAATKDGKWFAAASRGRVSIHDSANGKVIQELQHPTSRVRAAAFSADSKLLATAGGAALRTGLFGSQRTSSTANAVCIWNAKTGQQLLRLDREPDDIGHTKYARREIRCLAFSPDGKLLATGESDGAVVVYDAASGKLLQTLRGHFSKVWSLSFSANGQSLASAGGEDLTALVWDLQNLPPSSSDSKTE